MFMQTLMNLDAMAMLWIQDNLRSELLSPLMIFVTSLGNGGVIWIVAALAMIRVPQYRKGGYMVIAVLIVSLLINNLMIKNMVDRPRPWVNIDRLDILIKKPRDFSFPSGHTASSFASAIIINRTVQGWMGIAALVLAIGIGVSRMYIGVHYPSDVLAGMISGILIAMLIWHLVETRALF